MKIHHPDAGIRPQAAIPNYIVSVLRPDDLLSVQMEYSNWDLQIGGDNPPVLVRQQTDAPIIVTFAPQRSAEQAFYETAAGYDLSSPR